MHKKVIPGWKNENLDDLWNTEVVSYERKINYNNQRIQKIKDNIIEFNEARTGNIEEICITFGREPSRDYTRSLNNEYFDKVFLDDMAWPMWRIVLKDIRQRPWINMVQGAETARRLESLNIVISGKKLKGKIYINLKDYDLYSCMAAMYSNPNRNMKGYILPTKPDFLKDNPYAITKITDMEISNLVRNKEWWDLVEFIDIVDNKPVLISKHQAEIKYGIKYIGDILS